MSKEAEAIIKSLIAKVTEIELKSKIVIPWTDELPKEGPVTAREVCNAIGRALTKAGIPNNLEKP